MKAWKGLRYLASWVVLLLLLALISPEGCQTKAGVAYDENPAPTSTPAGPCAPVWIHGRVWDDYGAEVYGGSVVVYSTEQGDQPRARTGIVEIQTQNITSTYDLRLCLGEGCYVLEYLPPSRIAVPLPYPFCVPWDNWAIADCWLDLDVTRAEPTPWSSATPMPTATPTPTVTEWLPEGWVSDAVAFDIQCSLVGDVLDEIEGPFWDYAREEGLGLPVTAPFSLTVTYSTTIVSLYYQVFDGGGTVLAYPEGQPWRMAELSPLGRSNR